MSAARVVRRIATPPARLALRSVGRARTRGWPAYSRLFVLGERTGWSVDEDAAHLAETARRLGYEVAASRWAPSSGRQSVFHSSHFAGLLQRWLESPHRLGVAYLHGRPGTAGMPEFDVAFEALRRHADRVHRVQVTHAEIHELVIAAGVSDERVFRIPIGIDIEHFPRKDDQARARARATLGLPQTAFVVGSFQKDGVGWGDGLQPKLIKGPDVLVAALTRLQELVPDLQVLLTGPARGYVQRELARRSIPRRHVFARSRADLARAYQALDVYIVASRQEGGPKAVLESMASGVPLVTTRVGQASELVQTGRNGALVDVEDVEELAYWAARIHDDAALARVWTDAGRVTAEEYAYERLDEAWNELLRGFVDRGRRE